MASAKDDVFLKVEAVLSVDWVKSSGKDLTTVLEEIENLGIESINFSRGNHILVGSLDQLVRIRENFLGREGRSPSRKPTAACSARLEDDYAERRIEPPRNNLSRKGRSVLEWEREAPPEIDWPAKLTRDHRPNTDRASEDRHFSKELMVDNDIWEYIENKKSGELKDLETMFAATLAKAEDDSGVLKISITPRSVDTTADEVVIMHETLVGIYQETFMRCVIEKHEVHFSNEEAELVLEYIAEKFPDVFAKRCIYNDDFLFIGPPRLAREARQQFQVLAQRLKGGQLRTKIGNKAVLDEYDRARRRRDSYGDRYNIHDDDLYAEPSAEFTNHFENVPNEEVVVKENHNRRGSFAEDEGAVLYAGGDDTTEEPNDEHSSEEDDQKAEEEEPELKPFLDLDLPVAAAGWSGRDESKHERPTDSPKHQSGSLSLIYWRQDGKEQDGAAPKRSSSDVEDDDWKKGDDWKKEFSSKNSGIEKVRKTDELKFELPADEKSEKSFETKGIPDFAPIAGKAAGSTASLCDDDGLFSNKSDHAGTAAEKSLEDVSDHKTEQVVAVTQADDGVPKRNPPIARIDANSITYRSLDPGFSQQVKEEPTWKGLDDFVYNSTDDKAGSGESLEKKPKRTAKMKSLFDSGPKVKIIKQTIPVFGGLAVDNTKTEIASESKVIIEPSEKSSGNLACGGARSRPVKSTRAEVLGPPSRPVSELERRELKEVFWAQKKSLKKMPFDSSSSSDDDPEREAAAWRRGRKEAKDDKLTHQMIEELMARGDEASQRQLQLLLEKTTDDAIGGKEVPIYNEKVENNMVGKAVPVGEKINVDVPAAEKPAAEKPAASGRRTRPKITSTVLQPPDGNIGCVIDKAFHLEGHQKSGTIEINISFEAGYQADDQLEPGVPYKGMTMKAFLPASGDGRETLRLMKAAFTARKLFTLQDNGDEYVLVPNGVVFKDSADQFPDAGYLPKVMEQLRLLTENQM